MGELRNEEQTELRPLSEMEGRSQAQEQGLSSSIPRREGTGEGLPGDGPFVSDCNLETDLEMYFPDQYVPSDSERMLLYRELDNTRNDEEVEAYCKRLIDRFGPLPPQAEELLHVVALRRYGKALGCEKIMLKQGRMFLYFVSNARSPFYQSEAFGRIITYATTNVRRCNLREQNGKRSMVITDVPTVGEAVKVLKQI